MFNLNSLIDAKCYRMVRQLRWSEGVCCPHCESAEVIKRGKDDTQPQRQRDLCKACGFNFDDLTNTIFAIASSASAAVDRLFVSDGIKPVE